MKKISVFFLLAVISIYFFLYIFDSRGIMHSISVACKIFLNVLPIIPVIIILMGISNYIFKPKSVERWLGRGSGIRGWLIALSFGIFSHGPMYLWYPLLKDLKDKGMGSKLIAAFLYSRSVKLPLLPILVLYFGYQFTLILIIFTIIGAIIEGKILERLD